MAAQEANRLESPLLLTIAFVVTIVAGRGVHYVGGTSRIMGMVLALGRTSGTGRFRPFPGILNGRRKLRPVASEQTVSDRPGRAIHPIALRAAARRGKRTSRRLNPPASAFRAWRPQSRPSAYGQLPPPAPRSQTTEIRPRFLRPFHCLNALEPVGHRLPRGGSSSRTLSNSGQGGILSFQSSGFSVLPQRVEQ